MTRDKTELPKHSLVGLFANLKAADAAARGLIALGLTEDQLEIVDLTKLIAEHNPEFAKEVGIGTADSYRIGVDDEAIESLARNIAETVDLPLYLVNLGVPVSASAYYASKIREGLVLLVAIPGEARAQEATRLLDEVAIRDPAVPLSKAQDTTKAR